MFPSVIYRAVLYIVHGVAEHSGRYENLAALLNENEIAVYSQDLGEY